MSDSSALVSEQSLFSSSRLEGLSKWPEISQRLSAIGLIARPLQINDYDHGYLDLLTQLTTVGEISKAQFETRFKQMRAINEIEDHYAIVVIVDKTAKRIVAASTLILEYKFIHECALRARLEEVAVLDTYRGRRIGELIVQIIVELSRESFRCYKLSLDCTDELKTFYARNKFQYGSNMLSIRFT